MSRIKAGGIYRPSYRRKNGQLVRQQIWWLYYSKGGRQFRESARTTSAAEAVRRLKQVQGDIASGRFTGQVADRARFSALLDLVLEDYRSNERRSLYEMERKLEAHVRPALGQVRIADLTTGHIKRYVDFRRSEGAANATINRELAIVRRAVRLAIAGDPPLIGRLLPVRLLPERNVREGFLRRDKYRALLDALPADLKLLLIYGYHLGCRRGELLALRRSDVDLASRTVRFSARTTKNEESKVGPIYGDMVPWTDLALTELQKYPTCPWLFHRAGTRIRDFRKAWKTACVMAGVPGLLFHDLRRSAVKNMEDAGIPRKTAMQITGHKTESIYRRYHIVSERDIREVGSKMETFLGEQAPLEALIQ
jgi:integrase